MMKIVKFLLNSFVFAVTLVVVMFTQYVLYASVAYQTEDIDRIYFINNEETEGQVLYMDALLFWTDGISAAIDTESKYIVRTWFDSEDWVEHTEFIDVALSFIMNVTVPAIMPIKEIDNVIKYHDASIYDFEDEMNEIENWYADENGDGGYFATALSFYLLGDMDKLYDEFRTFYNYTYKIERYSSDVYDEYIDKFTKVDENGELRINDTVIMLYFQILIAIIMSFYFVSKNQIDIRMSDDKQTQEIKGNLLGAIPGAGTVKKMKKKISFKKKKT